MSKLIHKLIRKFSRTPDHSEPVAEKIKMGHLDKRRIKSFLPPNPIIVEAGAHVGNDTFDMSRAWPNGHIHAFEPIPELYSKLKSKTRRCSNVTCYPFALSTKSGKIEFNVSGGKSNASSSILAPKQHLEQHPDVTFDKKISVDAVTIDDWAKSHGIDHIDFLWLDLQGYELFAMKSAEKMLPKVRAIFTEVFLKESYQGAPLYPDVRGWLLRQGFAVEWEGLPWPDSGNVFFVRR